jgi:hypothetical protein
MGFQSVALTYTHQPRTHQTPHLAVLNLQQTADLLLNPAAAGIFVKTQSFAASRRANAAACHTATREHMLRAAIATRTDVPLTR